MFSYWAYQPWLFPSLWSSLLPPHKAPLLSWISLAERAIWRQTCSPSFSLCSCCHRIIPLSSHQATKPPFAFKGRRRGGEQGEVPRWMIRASKCRVRREGEEETRADQRAAPAICQLTDEERSREKREERQWQREKKRKKMIKRFCGWFFILLYPPCEHDRRREMHMRVWREFLTNLVNEQNVPTSYSGSPVHVLPSHFWRQNERCPGLACVRQLTLLTAWVLIAAVRTQYTPSGFGPFCFVFFFLLFWRASSISLQGRWHSEIPENLSAEAGAAKTVCLDKHPQGIPKGE